MSEKQIFNVVHKMLWRVIFIDDIFIKWSLYMFFLFISFTVWNSEKKHLSCKRTIWKLTIIYTYYPMRTDMTWYVLFLSVFVIWHRHVSIDRPLYTTMHCVRSQLLILSYLLAPRPVCILFSFAIGQFLLCLDPSV
jgi:hypothetical protein